MSRIVVEHLTKTFHVAKRQSGMLGALRGVVWRDYNAVTAVNDLSFTIAPGELVGYIGPNGAGKSTTIKILAGILVPDGGRCEVGGLVPWKQRVDHVSRIGVVFGQRSQLWWDLPVIESFDLLCDIYRLDQGEYRSTRDSLVEMLAIQPQLNTPVRQLSLGQRMRCDLAAALLHRPGILFLDEPTIGLDAVSKLAVRDFVRQLNHRHGTTVILTTHDMDDIEALCDRVLVINEGSIVRDGTLESLRMAINPARRLIIDLEDETEQVKDPDAQVIRHEGHRVHLEFDPSVVAPSTLIARVASRYKIHDLFVENPPIEQLVAQLYKSQRLEPRREVSR